MEKLKFNAKNFMRVLRYIKRYPAKWNQWNPTGPCGCFLFHANRLGRGPRFAGPITTPEFVSKWLGVTKNELHKLYHPYMGLADFEDFCQERSPHKK